MESNEQYESRSLAEATRHIQGIEGSPLSERKDAAKEFLDAMKDPALVAERIGWLFNGDYGYGEKLKARQVLGMAKNANKVAILSQLIGAFEWRCPPAMSVSMWKKLSKPEQETLKRAIEIVIEEAVKDIKENG